MIFFRSCTARELNCSTKNCEISSQLDQARQISKIYYIIVPVQEIICFSNLEKKRIKQE